MQFGDYIKICRERFGLTQNALADILFGFHEIFHGLDTVTLSRWERNITSPNILRQRYFIEAMQQFEPTIFPAFDAIDMDAVERSMFQRGIERVIGKHKPFILDFPSDIIEQEAIAVTDLANLDDPMPTLKITHAFIRKVTDDEAKIPFETFKTWAMHPGSKFLLATYHQQFFGMLFSLRLKPDIFEKMMHFQMLERHITTQDLAQQDEEGCEYPFSLFAYTQQSATILSLRYYRYLITCQAHTACAGTFPKRKEGAKLASTLGLAPFMKHPQDNRSSYRANMVDVLLNRYILAIIFKESNRA